MQFPLSGHGANPLGFVLAFLLSFFLFQDVLASPTPERSLAKRYSGTPSGVIGTGGPDTSDYPSDDDIRSAFTSPPGPFVFFSQIPDSAGGSNKAYQFAQQEGGVIFRGAFPAKYTNRNKRSLQWYQDFADRFSGVFAEKASNNVYIVSNFDNEIDACRVWNRIEFPTLKDNADVTTVTLVDYTDFTNTKVIYTANGLGRREAKSALAKRDSYCYDWDGYGDDPEDPDSAGDGGDTAYATGWCGVHITQYQKNEGPGSDLSEYRYDVYLKDANGETIGESLTLEIANGATADVDSALPYVFEVTSGSADSDPVNMAYAGQSWNSNDQSHDCDFGSYDSGSRNGDCGFTC